MAGDDLIDAYVRDVAARLGRWPAADREDVVDELRDHLVTSVEVLIERGESGNAAWQRVSERFGPAELIAAGLLAVRRRRLTDPPRLRHAATLCCALWPALALGWWLSLILEREGADWDGPPQAAYLVGAAALVLAASLTVTLSVTVARAHGGLGWWGRTGTVCGVAAVGASVFGWMVPVWGGLLALSTLAVAVGLWRRDVGPRTPMAAFAVAWAVAAFVWCAAQGAAAPLDDLLAVSVGAGVATPAAFALRRRLVPAAV